MKKITTVLAMIALTLTFSTLAFGQHSKRNGTKAVPPTGTHLTGTVSGMQGDNQISVRKVTSDEHGTVYGRNNASQHPQSGRGVLTANTFGRGVIMANPQESPYDPLKARRQSQAAGPNNVSINGGAGNDKLQSAVASSNQRGISSCGAGCNGDTMLIPFKQRR